MIEFGFQPFPEPAPVHSGLSCQVQFEEYVEPTNPDEMLRRRNSGRVRVILTGDEARIRPYLEAIAKLWGDE